jgi:lysophospholipase L1-like esterase
MSRIVAFSLLALLLALPSAAEAQSKWHDRIRAFKAENAQLDPTRKNVVLLGSSSMQGWEQGSRVADYLPTVGPRVLNRGISGDGIGLTVGPGKKGIRNRLKSSVFDCNPSHVFILNGRNSMWAGPERVAKAYRALVREIKAELPDVVVCVVTVPPTNFGYRDMAPKVADYNTRLLKIAKGEGCWYIDLYPHLVGPDGLMRPTLTRDGLHMKNAGYKVLGRGIERVTQSSERKLNEDKEADETPASPCPQSPGAVGRLRQF